MQILIKKTLFCLIMKMQILDWFIKYFWRYTNARESLRVWKSFLKFSKIKNICRHFLRSNYLQYLFLSILMHTLEAAVGRWSTKKVIFSKKFQNSFQNSKFSKFFKKLFKIQMRTPVLKSQLNEVANRKISHNT